jgi:chemotaxis protein CheX
MQKEAIEAMPQDCVNQLDAAVAEVFELMLGKTCAPIEVSNSFDTGVASTIEISGGLIGSCCLNLSSSAAENAMSALVGECPENHEEMLEDTAGELCNMIVGTWKSKLSPAQASSKLSVPNTRSESDQRVNASLQRIYSVDGSLLAMTLTFRNSDTS